jgi:hypothetical protein
MGPFENLMKTTAVVPRKVFRHRTVCLQYCDPLKLMPGPRSKNPSLLALKQRMLLEMQAPSNSYFPVCIRQFSLATIKYQILDTL